MNDIELWKCNGARSESVKVVKRTTCENNAGRHFPPSHPFSKLKSRVLVLWKNLHWFLSFSILFLRRHSCYRLWLITPVALVPSIITDLDSAIGTPLGKIASLWEASRWVFWEECRHFGCHGFLGKALPRIFPNAANDEHYGDRKEKPASVFLVVRHEWSIIEINSLLDFLI